MPSSGSRAFQLPTVLLGITVLVTAAPLLLRAALPQEIDYNEGWNALRQVVATHAGALYGAAPLWSVTNYPPLSFHLIGCLAPLGFDVVVCGRCASVVAAVVVGLGTAVISRRLTGSRTLSAAAFFIWLAGLEIWTPGRLGADDPQLLAMALQVLAFLLVFTAGPHRWRLAVAAIVIAASLFTKHNLLALPLAMTLSFLERRAWEDFGIWLLAGTGAAIPLTAVAVLHDGVFFFRHLLDPRLFLPERAVRQSALFLIISAPGLAPVAVWAWHHRASVRSRLLIMAWAIALAEIPLFSGGDGVGNSIFQDALMMTAMLLPAALKWHSTLPSHLPGRSTTARLAPLLLCLPVLLLVPQLSTAWRADLVAARQAPGLDLAAGLLRAAPGPVVCEDLLLCFRARRVSFFDAYHVLDRLEQHRMAEQQVEALLDRPRLAAVEFGCEDDPDTRQHHASRFSAAFVRALATRYHEVWRSADESIYVPDQEGGSAARRGDPEPRGVHAGVSATLR